ncbi:MAG: response regulator [Rectinemataceae bacterium]
MFKLSTIAFAVCGLVALAFVVDGAALSSMGNLHGALWWRLLAVDSVVFAISLAVAILVHRKGLRISKSSEEELRIAKEGQALASTYASNILECFPEPVLVVDASGLVVSSNRLAEATFEKKQASIIGTQLSSLFVDPDRILDLFDKVRYRGIARDEAVALSVFGKLTYTLGISLLAVTDSGPPNFLVHLRDTEAAQKTEREALDQAAYLRNLIEASMDPLFALSTEGLITDVNEAATVRTGFSRDELLGMEFEKLFLDPVAVRKGHQRVLAEGSITDFPLAMKSATGNPLNVLFNASVFRLEQGGTTGIVAVARDVTASLLAEAERDKREWIAIGIARLNQVFQVQGNAADLARRILSTVAELVGAQVAAFYVADAEGSLGMLASYAYTKRKGLPSHFLPGEGIIGQAALERKQILLEDLPGDYIRVVSGLGDAPPQGICVTPLLFEDAVVGVIEIASIGRIADRTLEFLEQSSPMIAVAIEATRSRESVVLALKQSQELGEELEAQRKSLAQLNEGLVEQTARLQESEHRLQLQQAELETSNVELEQQSARLRDSEQNLLKQQRDLELANDSLTQSNSILEFQKAEIEQAKVALARQAEEVTLASKYKSEFLANMSHELRTPLNSLLLLARSLKDNTGGNLTGDQVESATVIYESGSDLLNLINEILDLSKVEAGKMELHIQEVELAQISRSILAQFSHMAASQGLDFQVDISPELPATVVIDGQRLGQILKNLIGNALKFTEKGGVSVSFGYPEAGTVYTRPGFSSERSFAIEVRDSGIGIAADKQKLIFEAFHQAETGDRRRFGGTGLGLSISREFSALLGGEIHLASEPGKGSTFTLYLPLALGKTGDRVAGSASARGSEPGRAKGHGIGAGGGAAVGAATSGEAGRRDPEGSEVCGDDRDCIGDHDRVMLLIEDDRLFAGILSGIMRERGFKVILAGSGEEGLARAREFKPHGIILDIGLPDMDGWSVLDSLKRDVSVRHIPVHIVSGQEPGLPHLGSGAIGFATKPIDRERILEVLERIEAATAKAHKRVLVVEDDEYMRKETVRIIGDDNVEVDEVTTGRDAIDILSKRSYDLAIIDLGLPDMQGLDLLRNLTEAKVSLPPVIIHTARELTLEEEFFLRDYSDSVVVKDVRSQERLIDEVALFLHRVVRDLPDDNKRAILHLHDSDESLRGRKVLIVEDDMRTMFAMARTLAGHGMVPLKAENGQRALTLLDEQPDVDLVLMDIMMPVMDGYEATKAIRAQERFARLPIIALTAKAMKEDRQKCIDAGATDYLAKPVDLDRLASLMRILLCR